MWVRTRASAHVNAVRRRQRTFLARSSENHQPNTPRWQFPPRSRWLTPTTRRCRQAVVRTIMFFQSKWHWALALESAAGNTSEHSDASDYHRTISNTSDGNSTLAHVVLVPPFGPAFYRWQRQHPRRPNVSKNPIRQARWGLTG